MPNSDTIDNWRKVIQGGQLRGEQDAGSDTGIQRHPEGAGTQEG